jgi:hypothetical protein
MTYEIDHSTSSKETQHGIDFRKGSADSTASNAEKTRHQAEQRASTLGPPSTLEKCGSR